MVGPHPPCQAVTTGANLEAISTFYAAHASDIADHISGLAAVLQDFVLANEDPTCSPNLADAQPDNASCILAALAHPCITNGSSGGVSSSSGGGDGCTASSQHSRGCSSINSSGDSGIVGSSIQSRSNGGDAGSSNCSTSSRNCAAYTSSGRPVLLLLLKTIKILARKGSNRQQLGPAAIPLLVSFLTNSRRTTGECAAGEALVQPKAGKQSDHDMPTQQAVAGEAEVAEVANAVLNLCYEASNVVLLLGQGQAVARLVALLAHASPDVRANAAGALQSVCFQPQGRKKVRELGGVGALLHTLSDSHPKVLQRAAGALHNLSSDAGAIRAIRTLGGIPSLVKLLGSEAPGVAGAAAGAIQNVSREVASRLMLRDLKAASALMGVLASSDTTAQVCAAGALLNILGPEIDAQEDGPQQRRAFGRLLSLTMAAAAVQDGMAQQLADWRQEGLVC